MNAVGPASTRDAVPRLVVLRCAHWPVVVARAQPDEPVAVVRANRVIAHSRAAEGIAVGQRRREAQSRCPHVRIVSADPEHEARMFEHVVLAVGVMVPRLEVTEPGTLTFTARGPARYFGGEEAMALAVVERAEHAARAAGIGIDAVAGFGTGVGDGRFAAGVAARSVPRAAVGAARRTVEVVPAGGAEAYLADRPVDALVEVADVPPELVHLLHRLGIHRLGALAALPAADLSARFGAMGAFAHRLATGADDRLPGAHDPPAGREIGRAHV